MRVLIAGCLLVGLAAPVRALSVPHRGPKHEYQKEVEQLEDKWRNAQLKGDAAAMDELLDDEYIGITANGLVTTKAQQLERVRAHRVQLNKLDFSDVKVKILGETAVVTCLAEVEGENDGVAIHGMYRYTRVYARLANGSWKIMNFEATRITPAKKAESGVKP